MEPYQTLEKEIGQWAMVDNVVACSSGTSAIHLALEALQLPPGSEVLVPNYAMIAVARAVILAGLTPVFVDCGNDLLLNPDRLYEYTSRPQRHARGKPIPNWCNAKAILTVHTYGRLCNMEAICRFANRHNLYVIEDCAESHGATHEWVTAAKCWSFYRNKIIAGEEGGAVSFLHAEHAALARSLRSMGFTEAHDFTHIPRGHNYRMSNAHARMILGSLRMVDVNLRKRREVEQWYNDRCPAEWRMLPRDAPWVYDLRIPGMTVEMQTQIIRTLNEAGIAARHGFKFMTQQPEYRNCTVISGDSPIRPEEIIYLPIYPDKNKEQTVRAFEILNEAWACCPG